MRNFLRLLLASVFIFSTASQSSSCSMFKITLYGKTLVGNNEDSWQLTSRIWFENGTGNGYGAVYTGYSNGFPQGGMNTAGLVFDGFTVYPRKLKDAHDKKKITDPTAFVKQIMQSCGSVEEVQAFAGQYDRSYFNNGMFLFVDKTGNYLVIEADTMIAGADEKYVLANFCPSLTPDPETVKIGRYRRGKAFLEHGADTSITFCTAAMDTMHECRPGLGDGTLYTTIYDTETGEVHLYFYHDYRNKVAFNLQEELQKGDHSFAIPELFPPNSEYTRLQQYKTPAGSQQILLLLVFCALFFAGMLFYIPATILLRWIRKRPYGKAYFFPRATFFIADTLMAAFLTVLILHPHIVYGSAPFRITEHFSTWNLSAYVPFITLIFSIPVLWGCILLFRQKAGCIFSRCLFLLNATLYMLFLVAFGYWGLYDIF